MEMMYVLASRPQGGPGQEEKSGMVQVVNHSREWTCTVTCISTECRRVKLCLCISISSVFFKWRIICTLSLHGGICL